MLLTKSKQAERLQGTSPDVRLMEGEEVQESLGTGQDEKAGRAGQSVLLLTDRRVIHVSGSGANRKTSYAAIEDINAVEITRQSVEGYSAYIWAVLAFFVAAMLWRVIENQTLSLVAAGIVALMGVYLIVDRVLSRGEHALVFKAGGAEIQCPLNGNDDQPRAEALVTRLFELKDERNKPQFARASTFSPR